MILTTKTNFSPSQIPIVILLTTTFASAIAQTDYRCGSLEVRPCKLKHGLYEKEGFVCSGIDEKCLDRRAWCSIGRWYDENDRCNASDNLMFDKCLEVEKSIRGSLFHVNMAQVDWTVAEQYCQSRGLNLASFQDQNEYDDVIKFLQSISTGPKEIATRKDVKYRDKLAQRCWAVQGGTRSINLYWIGLVFDRSIGKWTYTNGNQVNYKIKTISSNLRDAVRRRKDETQTGYVGVIDKNYDFFVDEISDGYRRVDSMNNRAGILCKSGKHRKWSGGIPEKNQGCITGFKCSGRESKCITGVVFKNSDVCNGITDCFRGDDETSELCFPFTARFPDGNRAALLVPYKRNPTTARRICERENMTLPSVHSRADIEFLRGLPRMFATNRRGKSPDLLLSSENWNNLATINWKIVLGIRGGSKSWDDGSPVGYLGQEIADLASANVYLVFNRTASGKLVTFHENEDDVYPICQGKSYHIIAIPSIITINGGGRAPADYTTVLLLLYFVFTL